MEDVETGAEVPSQLDYPDELSQHPPLLAAAFLVKFDVRKGYVLTWQRSIPGIQLEGIVEYKSLPSGLHNVEQDLIYFVHERYAGISAFEHQRSEQAQRNALMLAVGVLVPLDHGRLGKSWRHAQSLKALARQIISNPDNVGILEDFWAKHRLPDNIPSLDGADGSLPELNTGSPHRERERHSGRRRGISDATAIMKPSNTVAPYHPALALPDLMTAFGPLIFPVYRAALLRKRILFVGGSPVQTACDYVYGVSVLSSLPNGILQRLPSGPLLQSSLRPLFNVGIHDIPLLSRDSGNSWIACTTDDVLSTKPSLFDILITLPSTHSDFSLHKTYPKIIPSDPALSHSLPRHLGLKATQRDVRRYANLRAGLHTLPSSNPNLSVPTRRRTERRPFSAHSSSSSDSSSSSVISTTSSTSSLESFSNSSLVEPVSWPHLAYTSFMWWASAGEKGAAEENAENEHDSGMLLTDLDAGDEGQESSYRQPNWPNEDAPLVSKELALVSYFHRLTACIFSTLAETIEREEGGGRNRNQDSEVEQRYSDEASSDDGEEGSQDGGDDAPLLREQQQAQRKKANERGNEAVVMVTADDMARMGLDVWSRTDREFVEELMELWWGRRARVIGGEVRCCGVRVL
ncbi:MAG: hypothetical protein Q9227_007391 [Pyrenula ochraceoflavens]